MTGMLKSMMRLLLLLSLPSHIFAQTKNDSEKSGLLGRVKSVEWGWIEYTLKDGKSVEGRRQPNRLTTYDEDGNAVEVISYKDDGSVSGKNTYQYDAKGRNVGSESSSESGEQVYKQKQVYTLDDKGNRVEVAGYQTDGTLSHRQVFKYDADGNKIEELFYSWNGTRVGRIVNTYDGRGNQLTQVSYNADDSVSFKSVNSYDALNNKIEWVQYHGDTLRYRVLYTHDDKGRLKEQETFEYNAPPNLYTSHAPVPGRVVYTYHDKERTKEEVTYDAAGNLVGKVVTSLDEKGNQVSRAEYGKGGAPKDSKVSWYDKDKLLRTLGGKVLTKLEYDPQGNWTKKTYLIQSADSGKPEAYGAEYRVITYY
jgi:hypothetical protein